MTFAVTLAPDDPVELDADFQLNAEDRRYVDDQIRAIQQILADLVVKGRQGTMFLVDSGSAALVAGDWVCVSPGTTAGDVVTKATAAALALAGRQAAIVLQAAQPGTRCRCATFGIVPPSVTGLSAGGYVRINTTTARCEIVAVPSGDDYLVGFADSSGNLTIASASPALALPVGTSAGDILHWNNTSSTWETVTNITVGTGFIATYQVRLGYGAPTGDGVNLADGLVIQQHDSGNVTRHVASIDADGNLDLGPTTGDKSVGCNGNALTDFHHAISNTSPQTVIGDSSPGYVPLQLNGGVDYLYLAGLGFPAADTGTSRPNSPIGFRVSWRYDTTGSVDVVDNLEVMVRIRQNAASDYRASIWDSTKGNPTGVSESATANAAVNTIITGPSGAEYQIIVTPDSGGDHTIVCKMMQHMSTDRLVTTETWRGTTVRHLVT